MSEREQMLLAFPHVLWKSPGKYGWMNESAHFTGKESEILSIKIPL